MSAVKGDWSGMLTSIPSAGELFHLYMTGLGWVRTPQTTGVPASLIEPNPIEWKLHCELLPDRQPLKLVFAGLAPGMLGVYQSSFRMPRLPAGSAAPTGLSCILQGPYLGLEHEPNGREGSAYPE
jgi:uncharacterized protein (TIGR03437 family)